MAVENNFHCDRFHLDVPTAQQPAWCAKQFRKGRDFCVDCKHGKAAAKMIPETRREGEETMEKAKCSCGKCGANVVKEGLGWGCYKKKYGKSPFPSGQKKDRKAKGRATGKAPSSNGAAYKETAEEEYLRKIGMTQIADELKKLRLVALMAKEILG
jgi:hypothetical protein